MEKSIVTIKIEDGCFVSYECAEEANRFEKKLAIINGWRCTIYPDGGLKCSAFLRGSSFADDKATLKISITGHYKFSIKVNGIEHCLKSCQLDKWPDDGKLVLILRQNGRVNASFRSQEYEDFLELYGIDIIKREEPNGVYRLYEREIKYPDTIRNITKTIQTDGKIEQNGIYVADYKGDYYEYNIYHDVIVSGATWVITTVNDSFNNKPLSTLYAIKRRERLVGLPIINPK